MRIHKGGVTIAGLGKGGCLGEGALVSTEARSATAVAAEDARLFSLSRSVFQAILERHAGVRESILDLHRRRAMTTRAAVTGASA